MLESLIISADQPLVWTVEPALRQLEFAVTVKPTIAEGMERLWRMSYHALVLDCAGGGLEALRQARQAPLNRDAMLIAIAAGQTPQELAEAGADAVWHRPLLAAQIRETLHVCRGLATGDRRLYSREPLDRAAFLRYSYNGEEFYQSVIVDVNESGLAIESLEPLPAGRAIVVLFALPAMLRPIQAVAQVVWRTDAGRAGLQFLQMSEDSERQLERWLRNWRMGLRSGYSYAAS